MLGAAQKAGIELFVLASSSSVYGNATPLPAKEESPAIVPESPYAASKRSAELVTSAMLRKTPKMRCASLRFFTVYGPRQRPEMAIHAFARGILAGRSTRASSRNGTSPDSPYTEEDDPKRKFFTPRRRATSSMTVVPPPLTDW